MKAIVLIICIVAIVAALIYIFMSAPRPQPTVTGEESYIILDSINTLSDEQLESISAEQTAFNTAIENDIALDMSIFYYE